MTQHTCHARGCTVRCNPEFLMCRKHWFMVPRKERDAVWATYRAGQCDYLGDNSKPRPSEEWHQAANAAIAAVAKEEARRV